MARSHDNDGEPTLALLLAISFFIGIWLLLGLGMKGVLDIITPDSRKSTLDLPIREKQIASTNLATLSSLL